MSYQTDDGKHEGWAAAEMVDGRFSVGSGDGGTLVRRFGPDVSADDVLANDLGRGVVDGRTAIGWRGLCECGWRGALWRKVTGNAGNGPPQEVLNKLAARGMRELTGGAHEVYDPAPSIYGDAPAGVEDMIYQEWANHLPPQSLADVRAAALAVQVTQLQLDDAVKRARGDGCSWADIGDAAGITRQSAHERWRRSGEPEGEMFPLNSVEEIPEPGGCTHEVVFSDRSIPCTFAHGHAGPHSYFGAQVDEYGDSDAERIRELTETGSSVRVTGRPIVESIIDALGREEQA